MDTVSKISKRVALALSVALLASCGEPQEQECTGTEVDGTFDIVETGQQLQLTCITFGTYGLPTGESRNPDYKHVATLAFEGGVHLEVWFQNQIAIPATLDLTASATADAREYGVDVYDLNGFEGGPRPLCQTPAGFPPRSAQAGTVQLDSAQIGTSGVLSELHGSIEATAQGCTFDSPAVSNQTVTLRGRF